MKSPRVLLLYEEGNTYELLRNVLLGEGCEVEEASFDTQSAGKPIEGYCLVLFDIQRPTWQLLEVLRACAMTCLAARCWWLAAVQRKPVELRCWKLE
jgi:hypothetical protein